jgi:hypothetical protein
MACLAGTPAGREYPTRGQDRPGCQFFVFHSRAEIPPPESQMSPPESQMSPLFDFIPEETGPIGTGNSMPRSAFQDSQRSPFANVNLSDVRVGIDFHRRLTGVIGSPVPEVLTLSAPDAV